MNKIRIFKGASNWYLEIYKYKEEKRVNRTREEFMKKKYTILVAMIG